MTLTLTPAARARFTAWLQDVGSANLRADAVESEMLGIMEDRAESGESMSYELGRRYTTTGRPEIFFADAKDFDDSERAAMTLTYTIAYDTESGMLISTEPDGADIDAAIAAEEKRAGVKFAPDRITKESGLVLTDEPRDDDDVRYCGDKLGHLTVGDRTWRYAVRRPS